MNFNIDDLEYSDLKVELESMLIIEEGKNEKIELPDDNPDEIFNTNRVTCS